MSKSTAPGKVYQKTPCNGCPDGDGGQSGSCAACTRASAEKFWADVMHLPGFLDRKPSPELHQHTQVTKRREGKKKR